MFRSRSSLLRAIVLLAGSGGVYACIDTSLSTPPDPLGSAGSSIEGGDPINEAKNPVSSQFPMSTVHLETPFTDATGAVNFRLCTGEVLAPNKILTAAHCKTDATTIVYFYGTNAGAGSLPIATTIRGAGTQVVQFGVGCDPDAPGSFPATCYSNWGAGGPGSGTYHYADLAVLTLVSNVPSGYQPTTLGPPNAFASSQASGQPTTWAVGTGSMNLWLNQCDAGTARVNNYPNVTMQWVPVYHIGELDDGGFSDENGSFSSQALFADPGDSGGPLYQYAQALAPGTHLNYNLMVIGVLSSETPGCDSYAPGASTYNTWTSVEYQDNNDWLLSMGGSATPNVEPASISAATSVETFGAAR